MCVSAFFTDWVNFMETVCFAWYQHILEKIIGFLGMRAVWPINIYYYIIYIFFIFTTCKQCKGINAKHADNEWGWMCLMLLNIFLLKKIFSKCPDSCHKSLINMDLIFLQRIRHLQRDHQKRDIGGPLEVSMFFFLSARRLKIFDLK